MIVSRSSRMCALGESGLRWNGRITSCTKIDPHECRQVPFVLINAASTAATMSPSKPGGSRTARAYGMRSSLRSVCCCSRVGAGGCAAPEPVFERCALCREIRMAQQRHDGEGDRVCECEQNAKAPAIQD